MDSDLSSDTKGGEGAVRELIDVILPKPHKSVNTIGGKPSKHTPLVVLEKARRIR
jgi:hypothetical protein